MRIFLLTLSILSLAISSLGEIVEVSAPIVSTPLGKLRGKNLLSRDQREYFGFFGIKFGNVVQRFELAEKVGSWKGIKDAIEAGPICAQLVPFAIVDQGADDCLFLNVFVPKGAKAFPVMVYIHGGAFMFGTSTNYGPDYFMDEDVIIVNLSYRCGSFGFLSYDDDVIEQNLGLKDQALALKWVQENIKSFGGDPSKVTIFGESAGASSVDHHTISSYSKGLFHRAISQSGSIMNPWSIVRNPKRTAIILGRKLNCPVHDSKALKACLQTKSIGEILSAQARLLVWDTYPLVPFGPTIEHKDAKNPFIPESPMKSLKTRKLEKIPFMSGFTTDEGLFFHTPDTLKGVEGHDLETHWDEYYASVFILRDDIPEKDQEFVKKAVKDFYFGSFDGKISKSPANLTNLLSDRYFTYGIKKSLNLHYENNGADVFPYMFDYEGDFSFTSIYKPKVSGYHGVAHVDELQYLFQMEGVPKINMKSKHYQFSKFFVKLWTSFAKTGAPSKDWLPISKENPIEQNWHQITNEIKRKNDNHLKERFQFWDNINSKMREMDYDELNKMKINDEL